MMRLTLAVLSGGLEARAPTPPPNIRGVNMVTSGGMVRSDEAMPPDRVRPDILMTGLHDWTPGETPAGCQKSPRDPGVLLCAVA